MIVYVIAAAALVWLTLRLASRLPRLPLNVAEAPGPECHDTRLGRAIAPAASAHPGQSGLRLIDDPADALESRLALLAAADACIDLQYYIWRDDESGLRLLGEARRAADRGVRVRLLLDDHGIDGLDGWLAVLLEHENIAVRLFNPFVIRKPKAIGFFVAFWRLNHRMHNKSITVDRSATIIGGRNIGDEYFGLNARESAVDLDVLAIGAIVDNVAADFERYWTSASAYPAELILPATKSDGEWPMAATEASKIERIMQDCCGDRLEWAEVKMVSDDPAKALGRARRSGLIGPRLSAAIGKPKRSLGLVSAYFVPTESGVAALTELAGQGVEIDILTNSLKANNVVLVHAGYAPSRRPLLAAGIRLWELKGPHPDRRARLKLRAGIARGSLFRSSGTALHAKTFSVDDERLFIGSFNFDPRSLRTNTEIGFVIGSTAYARSLRSTFDDEIPQSAYEVRLSDRGRMQWIERDGATTIVHDHEPGTGPLQRAIIAVLAHLPAKWML